METVPNTYTKFEQRHHGAKDDSLTARLQVLNLPSLEALIDETMPSSIRLKTSMCLPEPLTESQFLAEFEAMSRKNKIYKSYIGMGYHHCVLPPVILRNILENPAWYTAYTPYQAEISQGRLEMLLNFQTLISELTGLPLANASLLDEGTAAAEAMTMFFNLRRRAKKTATHFFVDENCHPQTIDVLRTRAAPLGIVLNIGRPQPSAVAAPEVFGLILAYPDTNGAIADHSSLIATAAENEVKTAVVADLLSLALLKPPGEMGADVVVGSAQRFGVPMGFGGPHAGFFATKDAFKRNIPGRIIGISKDADGKPAYRMALQTREQHIRREKATSNICTAQVLLAVIAAAYAVYHGPEGIRQIARRIHTFAAHTAAALEKLGFKIVHNHYFDTLKIALSPAQKQQLKQAAEAQNINFRYFDTPHIGIAFDETDTPETVSKLIGLWADICQKPSPETEKTGTPPSLQIPEGLRRKSVFMQHSVFSAYRTEHEMLRYLKKLENKDISLVHGMISLGSCTMKLNATTQMIPLTWAHWSDIHPFAPKAQAAAYYTLFDNLEKWLCEITGFEAISFQPNAGAQGEYTGLMTISAYHKSRKEAHRNVVLIPASAHGTNPASAVMAGMKVVIVKCDDKGNISMDDLTEKVGLHAENLAALMVTYPSTHGVFEEDICQICALIHENGGKVYMDGANMNAQVGFSSPAHIGADVCHLNLHKTFCIPHGGGGPGAGPIGVNKSLAPFLPTHTQQNTGGTEGISAVSAAPFGSASILTISYAYIALMGAEGLKNATARAILNANYMKTRLQEAYPVLYTGKNGRVAHEMIIDCRAFKQTANVEVEDIAKRLMDYGFHAPTVSFPVAGTLMIEPTESETLTEIDRFCDALIAIRAEIAEIETQKADKENNVLKNAPHPATLLASESWDFPYSRQKAAFPLPFVAENKYWPPVRRIDSAYGDRNLVCSCTPVAAFM